MTWLRLIALAFGGMLLLFFLLIGLVLFTSQGNQMLWAQAERMIPGLHGELVSGHLGRGWEFKELGFSSPELTFTSGRVKLVWLAGGLLSGKLVVDELNVEQLKLNWKSPLLLLGALSHSRTTPMLSLRQLLSVYLWA